MSKGGANDIKNLALVCRACNGLKGSGTLEEAIRKHKARLKGGE